MNKAGKPGIPQMSMEIRQNVITGNTNTIKDSVEFNSKNHINSINLNSPHKPKGVRGGKRESIYKQTLMQQLKNANLSQFSAGRSSHNSDESDEESDENAKQIGNTVKKSRFGQI